MPTARSPALLRFAVRRVAGMFPVLALAVLATFSALQLVPGDPIVLLLGDQSGDAELEARLRRDYGLDRPLVEQFWSYLAGVARLDFGLSFRFAGTKVSDILATGLRITPLLAVAALLLALPLGLGLGTFAAHHRGRWTDSATMFLLAVGISVPNFALAAVLVFLLSVQWRLLPVAGWGAPSQAVLPLLLLTIPPTVYIGRLTRTYMVEILERDYIRTARAKGLRERVVLYRHALRNALVPLLTSVGIIFGGLLSGTFVIETIFNIPGLGSLAIQSVFARDYPVVMAIVLLYTFLYSLINLIVDLLYGLVDPRIRYGG